MLQSVEQQRVYSRAEIRPKRLESLDVFRGLTLAFMILVNDPGDGDKVYREIEHAHWNGMTGADLIFPTFLFIMGCAIPFSFAKRVERGETKRNLIIDILKRSLVLLVLGWVINLVPYFDLHEWRLFGVLPRFAFTYAVCSILYVSTSDETKYLYLCAFVLLAYWLIVAFVPVPGAPRVSVPRYDEHVNIVAWIDQRFNALTQSSLGIGRLYVGYRDPEGLLSSLPACVNVLAGIVCGNIYRSRNEEKIRRWSFYSILVLIGGVITSFIFPFNKNLWSSSFVLFCVGLDGVLLYLLHNAVDRGSFLEKIRGFSWLVKAAIIFGSNSIFVYCFSEILCGILWNLKINYHPHTIGGIIYNSIFVLENSTKFTSLLYAICYVIICFIPNYILWRKKIIIKV